MLHKCKMTILDKKRFSKQLDYRSREDDLRIAAALKEIPAVQEIIFRERYVEIYLEHDLPEETIRQAIEGCGAYHLVKIDG